MTTATLDPVDIEAALETVPLPDDGRQDPVLAAEPRFVEFDDPVRLDPGRAGDIPDDILPVGSGPVSPEGPLVSFGAHLAVLLALLTWVPSQAPIAPPIQVALVFEQPAAPKPAEKQPQGPLTSADTGSPKPPNPTPPPPKDDAANKPAPPPPKTAAANKPMPPPPQEVAPKLVPPPPPVPTEQVAALELPPPLTVPTDQMAALELPRPLSKPPPPERPRPRPRMAQPAARSKTPAPETRQARYPGPSASRSEYLAYLVMLTRQHIGILPLSYVGSRSGEAQIGVVVRDDGTIENVGVLESSGYPDIDQRIERMVLAVGRFPPLPQWVQGTSMQLELRLRFPDALLR